MSFDIITLGLAKSYTDQHSGGGGSVPKPLTYDYMPEGYPSKSVQTTTLMEEQQVAFTLSGEEAYMAQITNAFEVVEGRTYTVNWDGAEYECVGVVSNSVLELGNRSIVGEGGDTGEPFIYAYNTKRHIGMFATLDTAASHTISVKTAEEIVTPMAEEFLPAGVGGGVQSDWNQNDSTAADYVKNRPFYTVYAETVLVEESTVLFADNSGKYIGQLESTFSATVGETYKVSWDGAVYESACVKHHAMILIGNLSIIGVGPDTGEPFVMNVENGKRIQIGTADTSASHTISISIYAESVVKIGQKYLPVASETEPGIISTKYLSHTILQQVENEYFSKTNTQVFGYGDAATIEECANKNNSYGIFSSGKFSGAVLSCYNNSVNKYITSVLSGSDSIECWKFSNGSTTMEQLWGIYKDGVVISSSTANSTKKFKITVDDSGTLTATEITA